MKAKIDQTDCKIIELLQKDGRMPNTMIAKKLGISEATVRGRLNRLIEKEYVQIVAVSNPLKLGFGVCGIMRIDVDIKKIDAVSKALSDIEELWYIVHATGSSYLYAEFNAKSIDALNDVISKRINKIDGLLKTETNLVLKFIKRRYDWKTAMN